LEARVLYKKPIEYIGQQLWLQKVTNPATGTFYQISDLPIEWRRNKENKPYPIKHANQIIRMKTADGKEWLKSKQQWIAVDSQGNVIMKAYTDLEVWDKPIFEYGIKPKDPKNPDGPKEHAVIGVKGFTKQYSMPFNEENLKSLYDMRPGKESSSVSLILLRIGYDDIPKDHPYLIENYEDLSSRPFDELWDYVSTPKYKLDRSYRDARREPY
jgi:hypothetical protein